MPAAASHGSDGDDYTLFAFLRRAPARWPWLAWLAVVTGIAAAAGLVVWTEREIEHRARSEFSEDANDVANQIGERIHAYSEVVYAARALVDASGDVTRRDFHRFARGLAIAERYPGIANVSLSFRVERDARPAYEQRMRTGAGGLLEGLPPFAISPAGERVEYVVLSYIEPLKDNAAALGLDLLSDPARADAVARARDDGNLSTTSRLTLLRDARTRTIGVLLRLAFYRGGGAPRRSKRDGKPSPASSASRSVSSRWFTRRSGMTYSRTLG